MITVVVLEEDVLRLICGYAPHSGRCFKEKKFSLAERICIV